MYAALIFAAFGMTACDGQEEKKESDDTSKEQEVKEMNYVLNAESSSLEWRGAWIAPGEDGEMMEAKHHTGTVQISDGEVTVKGDDVSGTFTIDMSTIENTDLEEEDGKGNLESHLKGQSEDKEDHFFRVSEFPTAEVTLNSLKDGVADLTINVLGIDVNEKVNVETTMEGDKMMMHGEFDVDFAALSMPMTTPNPEKPEDGHVNPKIGFILHVDMDKK